MRLRVPRREWNIEHGLGGSKFVFCEERSSGLAFGTPAPFSARKSMGVRPSFFSGKRSSHAEGRAPASDRIEN